MAEMNEEIDILRKALEFIASKSMCHCWEPPGMGSYQPYVWHGCEAYHSDDPEEWCLCCIAKAALIEASKTSNRMQCDE